MAKPEEFTVEMNYVPADGAMQFTIPGGASIALSYEDVRSFIQSIEAQKNV